jgi:hypothetical protein
MSETLLSAYGDEIGVKGQQVAGAWTTAQVER